MRRRAGRGAACGFFVSPSQAQNSPLEANRVNRNRGRFERIYSLAKILVIEDDLLVRKLIKQMLTAENHQVDVTSDGVDGQNRIDHGEYDVAVVDWDLPGRSGVEICTAHRQNRGATKVLILTGKNATHDKIIGLDSGADDYLTKPFEGSELLARVRALLRRPGILNSEHIKFGDLIIDLAAHTVQRAGVDLGLNRKEFAVLAFLAQNPNRAFSADSLLSRVWPSEADASPEALLSTVSRLRKKVDLPGSQSLITTVHGVGYKLIPPQ